MFNTKQYKTKTFYRKRNNGSVKGASLSAIDVGYSSVKIFSENLAGVFPSYAVRSSKEAVWTPPDTHIVYRDIDSGEQWLVGEAAQDEVSQGDATVSEQAVFARTRYDDPMFLVLARTGIGIGMTEEEYERRNGKPLHLQTGLPPRYMEGGDVKELKNALAGRHRFGLKVGSAPERIYDITVPRENIGVMEQPKGTLMSIAMDNSHRFVPGAKEYFSKNILIFDAGFETLDIYPIKNNHVGDKQTFTQFSMRQVFKETIDVIRDKYGEDVSLIGFQRCLGDGYVRCHGKFNSRNQEFGDILEAVSADVCDRAMEMLGQIYGLYEYDYLVITGGTGAAWNAMIREKLKGLETLTIVEGNQNDTSLPFMLANVRGYYMYLYEKVSRAVAKRG